MYRHGARCESAAIASRSEARPPPLAQKTRRRRGTRTAARAALAASPGAAPSTSTSVKRS
eukprot:8643301-Pyramimonas_sp.AAC.1